MRCQIRPAPRVSLEAFARMSVMSPSRSVCLSLFLCLATAFGLAQQSADPAIQPPSREPALTPRPSGTPTPNAAEGRIHLDVVVNDKAGNPVSGLDLNDFTLLDNNQPSKIRSFHAVGGPDQKPGQVVQAILVLDAANAAVTGVAREREEIDIFLRRDSGHLPLPISIFLFTDAGMKMVAQPSMDGNALAAQLDQAEPGLRAITRATGSNGAIERLQLSLNALTSLVTAESRKPGRKLLIWVGAGWPLLNGPNIQSSPKGYDEMFNAIVHLSGSLREARIALYNVSLGLPGARTFLYEDFLKGAKSARQVSLGDLSEKVFAIESGGRVLGPSNDLAGELATCVRDAFPYYTLTFDPPRPEKPDEYHDLKVQIGKAGLTARTNTGYYDQP